MGAFGFDYTKKIFMFEGFFSRLLGIFSFALFINK